VLLTGGGVGFAGIVRWTGLARFGHGFTSKCFATSRKAPSRIGRDPAGFGFGRVHPFEKRRHHTQSRLIFLSRGTNGSHPFASCSLTLHFSKISIPKFLMNSGQPAR
jgi:hypothetical protein